MRSVPRVAFERSARPRLDGSTSNEEQLWLPLEQRSEVYLLKVRRPASAKRSGESAGFTKRGAQ